MRVLLFLISVSILTTCVKKETADPIRGFELGSPEKIWKNHADSLEEIGILEEKDLGYTNFYSEDSTQSYYMQLGDGIDSLKVEFTPNYDGFYIGKLRSIDIDLIQDTSIVEKSDTVKYKKTFPATRKEEIDNIFRYFNDYYGDPTKSEIELKETGIKYYMSLGEDRKDSINILKSTWDQGGYKILFERNEPITIPDLDGEFYIEAYITYKSNRYNQELDSLKDSIRKQLTPDDIIEFQDWSNPEFEDISRYKKSMRVSYGYIVRTDQVEPRRVTDVKFDIIIENVFGEELSRIEDCVFNFATPLRRNSQLKNNSIFPNSYKKEYDIRYDNSLEIARKYEGEYRVSTDIKKIVFDDGKVLSD
ncbi:hypothetical protein SAMN05443144_1497 [Fodinibius roseus]|uniref:Uncharacterized protein n=1 Tax=Fodinibius roseus TaxID=1194090 RepID=A0A1M5M1U7_9BACT|nr:hypothetical protein [Fodinibius roseus]SHG71238.1 hypothetical protein SAMN05443144_1497 [Fodinibius roseus]